MADVDPTADVNVLSIAESQEALQRRRAEANRCASEDEDITFLRDAARSINEFGANDNRSNPLNLIRDGVGEAFQFLNSLTNPLAAFKVIKTPFEYAESFGRGLQDLVSSLVALDRTIVYQFYRVQNYRMSNTLFEIDSLCREINRLDESLNETVEALGDGFNFEFFYDDFVDRAGLAEDRLESAYDSVNNRVVNNSWQNASADLEAISTGSFRDDDLLAQFRTYVNTRSEIRRKSKRYAELLDTIKQNLCDQSELMENMKQSIEFEDKVSRVVALALRQVRDASDILGKLDQGCQQNEEEMTFALKEALSLIDAAFLGLDKADFAGLVNGSDAFFNFENLSTDSPCLLVTLEAYVDDMILLKDRVPDSALFLANQEEFLNLANVEAVNSAASYASDGRSSAYNNTQNDLNTCEQFSQNAHNVFDGFSNETGSLSNGTLDFLMDLGYAGSGLDHAIDQILNAKIFSVDSFREFMGLTPAGRALIAITDCLGASNIIPSGDVFSAQERAEINGIRDGLDSITAQIEKVNDEITRKMSSVFSFLNQIDSEIADFIASITSLLYFCDGETSYRFVNSAGYITEQQILTDINTEYYNNTVDDDGTEEQESQDVVREDDCRC